MKSLRVVAALIPLLPTLVLAQTPPNLSTYNILGEWHFEDTSVSVILDSSPFSHVAQVFGTSIVPGVQGTARQFSGAGDYVLIPSSSSHTFDFRDSVSFTIELWIKTTQAGVGMILRRGLAPVPGFLIAMEGGKIRATIGNRGDSGAPDTLLDIVSLARYDNGLWHKVRIVRDRSLRQLHLYIDGQPAASPVSDPIRFDLVSDHPLTMGRWENPDYPSYFVGTIDELYLVRGAFHGDSAFIPQLAFQPGRLEFGQSDFPVDSVQHLVLTNTYPSRSLTVDSILSSRSQFSVSPAAGVLPPNSSLTVAIRYAPPQPGKHSGIISIYSTDQLNRVVTVPVHGEAWGPLPAAQIMAVEDIPRDYGRRVRIRWYRSVYDDNLSGTTATEYSVWKRVNTGQSGGISPGNISAHAGLLNYTSSLWEFIAQIPAARFNEYASSVSTDADFNGGTIPWTVFAVATHLSSNEVLLSEPDSGYSVYGPWTTTSAEVQMNFMPVSIRLHQNFPNPFNPSTTIRYELPAPIHVQLSVYDILGREISVMVDETMGAGVHEVRFDGSNLASGVYLYRLTAGSFVQVRKLFLLR